MKPLSVSNWSRPRSPVTSAPQKSARACARSATALVAKLSGTETYDDELTTASNAAIDLIHDDKLNEAEAAARNLLVRYPEVPDGWDRLGMVHEKRGENRQAADCYRKLIAFVREHPDDFDAEIADEYAARVATLDPPAAG